MKSIRLDKYLTMVQDLTRSEARQYIRKGRVMVNALTVKKPEYKIEAQKDQVMIDGQPCCFQEYIYLMLNKPQGVVSATRDRDSRTVLDLVDCRGRELFPAGRLDKDTEGLLLLTDDGKLAHRLLSPSHHVDKCYYALLDKEVGREEEEAFAKGLDIGDEKPALPAGLSPAGPTPDGFGVYIRIQEGRFHQIKRMAKAVGREVLYLRRESMGSLRLDPALKPGEYRPLTKEELDGLLSTD